MSKHKTRKEKVIASLRRKLSVTEFPEKTAIPRSQTFFIQQPQQSYQATVTPSHIYTDLLRTLILTTLIIIFEIALRLFISK
ncbi:MAG: hypothetical protein AAB907_02405 [Patescibacteria group bacterium]